MQEENKNTQKTSVESEDYSVENPQESTVPKFNSTKEYRQGNELPGVENLNQDQRQEESDPIPSDDRSLRGEGNKTNLGDGDRDKDEPEDEGLIRV